ncbi:Hypothetical protein SLIV_18208 [Streptomyces lividans TK24]|uniref:Secreted protein n=1 Tax=Streptomyces lividans TK24 TaxID=457428 RepID=A0ABX6TPB8_STRLI|nr:Hypothetical protein SLIV_18208 [Streptomyces lividans TK24]QSJ10137.1 Hypothetical protein SLIVDG2_18208 [Streptomyces lividans]QTD71061.1 Hypothetical protein SLIVYQS_18208 [Streptomyces lividans TK24] [Streptomyces lividans]
MAATRALLGGCPGAHLPGRRSKQPDTGRRRRPLSALFLPRFRVGGARSTAPPPVASAGGIPNRHA